MKIELIKHPTDKTTVGWTITAEDLEEKLILGSIRHAQFWCSADDQIEYNGYHPDPKDDNYVATIQYATKSYKKELKEAFYASIKAELNKDDKNADLHI
jgi:L,D-peptidoglycan transpeptidase YkuD (ErfK/YbiS/YcfS/YnhG family)